MKKIIFLLCVVLFYSCATQRNLQKEVNYTPYYLKVYEADSLFIIGKYKRSYKVLDSIFKIFEPKNSMLFYEYKTYVKAAYLSNNRLNINKKVKKLVKNHGFNNESVKYDSILNIIFNINKVEYLKLRKSYLKKINFELRKEIIEMIKEDQFYRNEYQGIDLYKKRNEIDSVNQKKIKLLFDNNIYPNEEVIGNYLIDKKDINILFILLHTKDSIRLNYFLPKIKEFIIKGKCLPFVYGFMVDQYNLYNDKEQVYGTYNMLEIAKKNYPKYNKMRKKIGMPNIEFEIWRREMIMGIYK